MFILFSLGLVFTYDLQFRFNLFTNNVMCLLDNVAAKGMCSKRWSGRMTFRHNFLKAILLDKLIGIEEEEKFQYQAAASKYEASNLKLT